MCQVYANSVLKGLFHSVDIVQIVKSLRKVFQKIVFDEFLQKIIEFISYTIVIRILQLHHGVVII